MKIPVKFRPHDNPPNCCMPPKTLDHTIWLAYNEGLPNPVGLAHNIYWPNYLQNMIELKLAGEETRADTKLSPKK